MPVCVAQTVQKRTVRDATVRHDGNLFSVACHRTPLAAQPLATRAWKGPRATRWWMCWSAGTGWLLAAASALPRSLSCRARKLVAHQVLPGRVARRDKFLEMPWLAFPASSSCRGLVVSWFGYFVLEWLQRNHGGPWRSLGKPCRGVLQLPVHKFGILGYPYSSTPTGAPGPGPHTVPSAVGPGPKQGTGTRGLGYALSLSVPTAPSPNGTR